MKTEVFYLEGEAAHETTRGAKGPSRIPRREMFPGSGGELLEWFTLRYQSDRCSLRFPAPPGGFRDQTFVEEKMNSTVSSPNAPREPAHHFTYEYRLLHNFPFKWSDEI